MSMGYVGHERGTRSRASIVAVFDFSSDSFIQHARVFLGIFARGIDGLSPGRRRDRCSISRRSQDLQWV